MPEGKTETPQATRLPGLDALRGIAAIGIVIFHVPDILGNRLIANRFYLFVDLFFLLSGFVITLSAEPRLAQGLSLQSFMRARLRRLWPMLAFGIALHALAFIGQNGILHIIPLMILGLLMVPVLTAGGLAYPINGPQWSLVWELVANVAHAAGLRHLSDRALLLVAALAGLGALAAAHHAGCACSGPNVTNWWLGGARMAWAYTIGVWMARQWRKAPRRALVDWRLALALPVIALCALPFMPLNMEQGDILFTLLVLPALFWLNCTARVPAHNTPVLERLGALSFPLYTTHPAILLTISYLGESRMMQALALALAIAFADLIGRGGLARVAGFCTRAMGAWRDEQVRVLRRR